MNLIARFGYHYYKLISDNALMPKVARGLSADIMVVWLLWHSHVLLKSATSESGTPRANGKYK